MAIDTSVPRSRRALLAGGIGGMAALAASALGRPLPVEAANGEALILGENNSASAETGLSADVDPMLGSTFRVQSSSGGSAITGDADTGTGVSAYTGSGTGVYADAMGIGTGVYGKSGGRTGIFGVSGNSPNEPTSKPVAGVFGFCDSPGGKGVYGMTTTGTGLAGTATTGYALRTLGRLRIDKASGIATIAATKVSVRLTPGFDLTATSFVLLTPRSNLGGRSLWYTVDTTANTFTIRVSSAVTADLRVGWLLIG